jgi:hypothetical protein
MELREVPANQYLAVRLDEDVVDYPIRVGVESIAHRGGRLAMERRA